MSNGQKVMRSKQKVTRNGQKGTSNEQQAISNEQRATSKMFSFINILPKKDLFQYRIHHFL